MDYFLVYLNEDRERMMALPNEEGVYCDFMPFDEYPEKLTSLEVGIMKSDDYSKVPAGSELDDGYACFETDGKFIASRPITECIKEIGFERFFTSIIKEHMKDLNEK